MTEIKDVAVAATKLICHWRGERSSWRTWSRDHNFRGRNAAQSAPDPGKGRGLIAIEQICRGKFIEAAPVVILSSDGVRLIDQTPLLDYYFRWKGNIKAGGSGAIALGLVSLCNHVFELNAIIRPNYDCNTLDLYAATDIAVSNELQFATAHSGLNWSCRKNIIRSLFAPLLSRHRR